MRTQHTFSAHSVCVLNHLMGAEMVTARLFGTVGVIQDDSIKPRPGGAVTTSWAKSLSDACTSRLLFPRVWWPHPLAVSFIRMGKYVFVGSESLTRILAIATDKDASTQQQMPMRQAGS